MSAVLWLLVLTLWSRDAFVMRGVHADVVPCDSLVDSSQLAQSARGPLLDPVVVLDADASSGFIEIRDCHFRGFGINVTSLRSLPRIALALQNVTVDDGSVFLWVPRGTSEISISVVNCTVTCTSAAAAVSPIVPQTIRSEQLLPLEFAAGRGIAGCHVLSTFVIQANVMSYNVTVIASTLQAGTVETRSAMGGSLAGRFDGAIRGGRDGDGVLR